MPSNSGRNLQTLPAIFDELAVGFRKTGRRNHAIIYNLASRLIAGNIQRAQYLGGKLARLFNYLVDHVLIEIAEALELKNTIQPG